MTSTQGFLSEVRGNLGIIVLNSPKNLNALTLEMVRGIKETLIGWSKLPSIRAVLIRGNGEKSFCAGGDVKRVSSEALSVDPVQGYVREFFEEEYTLDYLIRVYSKPVIALGHGLVLGGGLGLLSGASIRTIDSKGVLGMPEISIGLYCDVGATYFLPRLPNHLGVFLGWTAARVDARAALQGGWVETILERKDHDEVTHRLVRVTEKSQASTQAELNNELRSAISEFEVGLFSLPESPVHLHMELISKIGALKDILQVTEEFMKLRAHTDPWIQRCAQTFLEGSPTSAFLIAESIRRGKTQTLEQCFQMEMTLSIQCARRNDFKEGVRARLIDKDQRPQWKPAKWEEVTSEWVSAHFECPWAKDENPLREIAACLN